jgi:glycerophosphoryl diester phosphodiesterase
LKNSIAGAAAAVVKNYAIECDVQCANDGEAIVFHDFMLDRLTSAQGEIGALTTAEKSCTAAMRWVDQVILEGFEPNDAMRGQFGR